MPWKARCNPSSNPSGAGGPHRRGHHHRHRHGVGLRRQWRLPQADQIVFGLSIAFAASSFFLSFFSFSGGAVV